MHIKGVHKVTTSGITYCYAWRGGPRMRSMPDDPGFADEYDAIRSQMRLAPSGHSKPAGHRKVALRTSARARLTVDAALNKAMDNAQQRARENGFPFSLTKDYIMARIAAAEGRCELSGLPFKPQFDVYGEFAHNPYGVSIDRIVPALGYVEGNVRLILTSLNFAINQWGLDAYLHVAKCVLARPTKPLPR